MKKLKLLAVAVLCMICFCSCKGKEKDEGYTKDFQAAVVVTSGNTDQSEILFYGHKLKKISKELIPYGNIASAFDPPVSDQGKVYMIPRGVPFQNEREEIIEFNERTHHIRTYEIGKPGLFAFDVSPNYIFTTNTLNGVSTLSRCDKKSEELKVRSTKKCSLSFVHYWKGAIYATANQDTKKGIVNYLLKFDEKTLRQKWKKEIPFSGDPCFFYSDQNNLYLSSGGEEKRMLRMDGKTERLNFIRLKESYPQQIIPYKGRLLVTHCDLTEGNGSKITIFNPQTGESELKELSHNVIQCQVKNENIFILSNESLCRFEYNGTDFVKQEETKISVPKKRGINYYISGFFVK